MKIAIESSDIDFVANKVTDKVIEKLKPLITNKHEEDIVYDVQTLSEYLRVSSKWVYERTQQKEIPYLKVNGLLRFKKRDIDRWLNSFNIPSVNSLKGKIEK